MTLCKGCGFHARGCSCSTNCKAVAKLEALGIEAEAPRPYDWTSTPGNPIDDIQDALNRSRLRASEPLIFPSVEAAEKFAKLVGTPGVVWDEPPRRQETRAQALGIEAEAPTITVGGPPCHCVYGGQRRRVAVGIECGRALGASLLAEEDAAPERWHRHELVKGSEEPLPPLATAAALSRRQETRAQYYARRARGE